MSVEQTSNLVLVVDDDPHVAGVLSDLLQDEGYHVETGVDGGALAAAFERPPRLILLDVMMPGMNGVEFCHRLKTNPRTQDVPVVFVTATPVELLTTQLGDCTYEGVIRKPFTIDEVLDAVQRHIA